MKTKKSSSYDRESVLIDFDHEPNILREKVIKILRTWNLGVGRWSRDQYFRILHTKIGH
jgi:hypothetical protein